MTEEKRKECMAMVDKHFSLGINVSLKRCLSNGSYVNRWEISFIETALYQWVIHHAPYILQRLCNPFNPANDFRVSFCPWSGIVGKIKVSARYLTARLPLYRCIKVMWTIPPTQTMLGMKLPLSTIMTLTEVVSLTSLLIRFGPYFKIPLIHGRMSMSNCTNCAS